MIGQVEPVYESELVLKAKPFKGQRHELFKISKVMHSSSENGDSVSHTGPVYSL